MTLKSDSTFFKNWVFLTCCRLGGAPDKIFMSRYALHLHIHHEIEAGGRNLDDARNPINSKPKENTNFN